MERMVTIGKAIAAIKTAAEEIPAEDFLSYSTILDVHLSFAHEFFSPEEQHQLLEALAEILNTHEDLARDISWDLVSVLLPFLESSSLTTLQTAQSLIASAAAKGNPREVFIKVLESLSSLGWAPRSRAEEHGEDNIDEDEDKATYPGDEDGDEIPEKEKHEGEGLLHNHSLKKFHTLLSALSIVHPRIAAKFPSRFLSTELTTLLGVFMKAVQWLEREDFNGILRAILKFVRQAKPELRQPRKQSLAKGEKPPLPPRVSTTDSLPTLSSIATEDSSESLLQSRLLQSFLSHVLEIYLLRTRIRYNELSTNHPVKTNDHDHDHANLAEDPEERGLVLGWASNYDEQVVRKEKSKVPGGQTLIDDERIARASRGDVKQIVKDIATLCEGLGLKTDELLRVCKTPEETNENADEEGENPEVSAPASAEEVPLSKVGSLFLLAERFTTVPISSITVFPDHEAISRNYLVLGSVQTQLPVVDAVLFLGAFAIHQGGGLGEVPVELEDFLMYLQTFAAISATASSPQMRFLAHYHVATVLKQHPDEAVRLAYIKDTLEHCPFESLKERVVLILKDEIIYATFANETRFELSRHENNERFVCTVCKHTTARRSNMIYHVEHEHSHLGISSTTQEKNKFLVCTACGIPTTRTDNMIDHVERKHPDLDINSTMQEIMTIGRPGTSSTTQENNKLLVCIACGIPTTRKDNMIDHVERKHPDLDINSTMQEVMTIARPGTSSTTQEKNKLLVCTACGIPTTRTDNMIDHVERKHPDLDINFIMQEIMTVARPGTSDSENSIFGSPVVLEELFPVLFPDLGELLDSGDSQSWEAFKNHYPTLVTTANFYYFLLKSPLTQERLGVCNKEHAERVESRFLRPLAKAVEGFKAREGIEEADVSMKFELDILAEVLERVADTRKNFIQ